jgi:molybdopterin/thiamine biosynthesis adenylyltransferase
VKVFEGEMRKRVVIVGAGALGSHVALLLRNAADLFVLDDDKVESKNVLAQFHSKGGIGRNKAVALSGLMQLVYGVKVHYLPVRLTKHNLGILPPDTKLVVDCVDNADGRRVCQAAASVLAVPCLHGGLAAAGAFGTIRWDEQFTISDAPAGMPTCEDGEHVAFVVEVASRMAMVAQRFLETGEKHGYAIAPDAVMRT